jgi:hypothetical protein
MCKRLCLYYSASLSSLVREAQDIMTVSIDYKLEV